MGTVQEAGSAEHDESSFNRAQVHQTARESTHLVRVFPKDHAPIAEVGQACVGETFRRALHGRTRSE